MIENDHNKIEKSNLFIKDIEKFLIAKEIERERQNIYDKYLNVNQIEILATNIKCNCTTLKTLMDSIYD